MNRSLYKYDILFVEDDFTIRQNYVAGLKQIFQTVYEAPNGVKGYETYILKKPHIMIVDIDMLGMSGLELIKKIRQHDKATKIIILTAYGNSNFLLEAVSLKLVKYLIKPVSRQELLKTLDLAVTELQEYTVQPILKIELKDGFQYLMNSGELIKNGESIALTPKERAFLKLLFCSAKKMFSYEEIYEYVWSDDELFSIDKIKTLVKKLRRKLPCNMIENVYGSGYRVDI